MMCIKDARNDMRELAQDVFFLRALKGLPLTDG